MNKTITGLVATGSPFSRVRTINEVINAMDGGDYSKLPLLLLTDEGWLVLDGFLRSMGCDPMQMDNHARALFIGEHQSDLAMFCRGVICGLNVK